MLSCTKHGDFIYRTDRISLSSADKGGTSTTDSVNSVSAKAYAIRLGLHNVVTGYQGPNKNESESGYVRGFSLKELNIYTLDHFDADHPAGSDISAYFLYNYSTQYTINYLVQERIMNYPQTRPNPKTEFDESYYFMLMQKPDSGGQYTFRLSLEFNDGSSYTDTTTVNLIL